MSNKIVIQNESCDPVASAMLEELAKQVGNQFPDIKELKLDKTSVMGEKCELATVLTFLSTIATGVISAWLWDLIKQVFSNTDHPTNYNWRMTVQTDQPSRVTVRLGKVGAEVTVETLDENEKHME